MSSLEHSLYSVVKPDPDPGFSPHSPRRSKSKSPNPSRGVQSERSVKSAPSSPIGLQTVAEGSNEGRGSFNEDSQSREHNFAADYPVLTEQLAQWPSPSRGREGKSPVEGRTPKRRSAAAKRNSKRNVRSGETVPKRKSSVASPRRRGGGNASSVKRKSNRSPKDPRESPQSAEELSETTTESKLRSTPPKRAVVAMSSIPPRSPDSIHEMQQYIGQSLKQSLTPNSSARRLSADNNKSSSLSSVPTLSPGESEDGEPRGEGMGVVLGQGGYGDMKQGEDEAQNDFLERQYVLYQQVRNLMNPPMSVTVSECDTLFSDPTVESASTAMEPSTASC